MSVPPTTQGVSFPANRDGEYWFAARVVFKDGHMEPKKVRDLVPDQKIYMNHHGKAVKHGSE